MTFGIAQDVVGLYVPVDDVLPVKEIETCSDIPDEPPCCLFVCLSDMCDCRGRAERHHEEGPVPADIEMMSMEKIRMVESICDLVLGLELLDSSAVKGDVNFYRHFEVETFVLGEPDLAERTPADFPYQAVAVVEQCSGLQFHSYCL